MHRYKVLKQQYYTKDKAYDSFQLERLRSIDERFDGIVSSLEEKRVLLKEKLINSFATEYVDIMQNTQSLDVLIEKCHRKRDSVLVEVNKVLTKDDTTLVSKYYLNAFLTNRTNLLNDFKMFNSHNLDSFAAIFNRYVEVSDINLPDINGFLSTIDFNVEIEKKEAEVKKPKLLMKDHGESCSCSVHSRSVFESAHPAHNYNERKYVKLQQGNHLASPERDQEKETSSSPRYIFDVNNVSSRNFSAAQFSARVNKLEAESRVVLGGTGSLNSSTGFKSKHVKEVR
eukprot:CAMPEP_0115043024 /NCGR_PEP_ID=MMETSP0216-20121206/46615_1 /TAXON_ID=223996 /ORGANISM="Protocruzia adherens, Strain Boccale" /LENGTH=284 /DNA_ID=CAMNT_0002425251 /DNA_START=320 /DNA_END=1171 /DNA_ORIENTATION=-